MHSIDKAVRCAAMAFLDRGFEEQRLLRQRHGREGLRERPASDANQVAPSLVVVTAATASASSQRRPCR